MKFTALWLLVVGAALPLKALAEEIVVSALVFGSKQNYSCSIVKGEASEAAAIGTYSDDVSTTGWGTLRVDTTVAPAENTTFAVAFAAGCVEGYLTQHRIYQYWANYRANSYPGSTPPTDLVTFMQKQEGWVRDQIAKVAPTGDMFWVGMAHLMSQFDGLVAGYGSAAPQNESLSAMDLYMNNAVGDLEDLNGLFKSQKQYLRKGPGPLKYRMTDCSGLVAILSSPGNVVQDIVLGHSTWRDYYAMLRTYKVYKLKYGLQHVVSFSSSPGLLSSKDDFYATPGLLVFETTNSIFNHSLYDNYITPASVLTWQRSAMATQWASSPEEWTTYFARNQSGTYNNQWVVLSTQVDLDSLPHTGFFYVLEQIPGTIVSKDLSSVLVAQQYWPSYNIPYFEEIYELSGYPAMQAKYGDEYSYDKCPRAQIFARNITQVTSVHDVQELMRYNNFQHDPISQNDPMNGIMSRADLIPSKPKPFGGVDSKVSSVKLASSSQGVRVYAISGPTHAQQQPFSFSQFPDVVRDGVPDTFDFDWVQYSE